MTHRSRAFPRACFRVFALARAQAFPRALTPVSTLALAAAALSVLLGGCGGATKTVTVSSAPAPAQTTGTSTGATQPTTSTAATPPTTTTAPTGTTTTGGGTPAPGSRTQTAPAFVEKSGETGASAEGLAGAVAVLHAHGFVASSTSEYHSDQTLRVLIGTGSRSNDGYDKQAFFFVDGRFIGTDSSQPSAQVSVLAQSDTEVTLAYELYRSSDPLCCPGGGQAKVRFQLNNGRLAPLDTIPPFSSRTGLSRQ